MSENYKMLRCESCEGELQYSEDRKSAVCLNCGNTYHFRDEKSEAVIMALNIANARRIACDFDTAVINYKALIERNPDDAEAHWGLVLSTYGIEYVEDPRTRKHIPTCRRTIRESILENADYKAALANAAPEQRAVYEEKAVIIDRLQKKIKRQLEDEEEYDVFISFKSTDENGNPTKDRQIARRIYDELNNRGIKTFFSEVTLKSRLGEDFEPIIYKALYSCKFFILVATSVENMNSAWVKNEWSRFRDRVIDEALSNPGCAVFENMGPNDLPPFLKGQGVSLAKYPAGGYEIEIADNLSAKFGLTNKNEEAEEIKRQIEEQKKLQQSLEEKLRNVQNNASASGGATIGTLLTRAEQELSVGAFEKAGEYFQKVADIDPTSGKAFWGLFLCDMKAKTGKEASERVGMEDLKLMQSNKNYMLAIKYIDQDLLQVVNSYLNCLSKHLKDKIEQLNSIYEGHIQEIKNNEIKEINLTNEKDEIIRKAKANGEYSESIFKDYNRKHIDRIVYSDIHSESYDKWSNLHWILQVGGIVLGIAVAVISFIISIWITDLFFGLIVSLVLGVIPLGIMWKFASKAEKKADNALHDEEKRMISKHNRMVDIANQVSDKQGEICDAAQMQESLKSKKEQLASILNFYNEFYSWLKPSETQGEKHE